MPVKGMRYESVGVDDVERYIADDRWVMQQKVDGIRCIVDTGAGGAAQVRFMSHTGDPLKSGVKHHAAIAAAVAPLDRCVLDGELLEDGSLWVFDVMQVLGTDVRLLPEAERRALLV